MTDTKTAPKNCGVCGKPIIAGYFTYGDYCGTTVCMQCMSKNTWSMCRKCNGTLLDYQHAPTTIDKSMLEDATESDARELFDSTISRLQAELARINAIFELAQSISFSSSAAIRDIKDAVEKLKENADETYIAISRKEARDKGPAGYIKLIPTEVHSSSLGAPELKPFVKPITVDYFSEIKYVLKLIPTELLLRVRLYLHSKKQIVYKMDAEYAEIVSRSGHACDIAFVRVTGYGPLCVAIKTIDNMVHIIYCEPIEYPYTSSRYVDYCEFQYPLSLLKLDIPYPQFGKIKGTWKF